MNKHLGHLLVLVALLGIGNGLGGGAGEGAGGNGGFGGRLGGGPAGGGGAGSVGGSSNAGAGVSPCDPSSSGLLGSGSGTAPKNASLGSSSGGGAGGSSGGSDGHGGHPLSGGSGLAGVVGTAGSSNGVSGSSDSTRSPSSASSSLGFDLTGGFGAGHRGVGVPEGAASDFGGGPIFDNFRSGFGSPSVGEGAGTGGSADGAGEFNGDPFSGGEQGFGSGFGTGWGSNGRPQSSFLTRGSGFGDGRRGGLTAWSSGGNPYGGEGAPGGGAHGFGDFNGGSEFGNFESGYGFPAGMREGLGTDGRGSGGDAEGFSAPEPEIETGEFLGSQTGHGGSFPSSSGFVGSPNGENPTEIGRNSPRSSLAQVLGGFQRPRLLPRLWQSGRTGRGPFGLGHRRRKTDPRVAAAVALGTLAGVAALGSLTAGIAAAVHDRRRNGVMRLGGARRGCTSDDCRRKKRSIPESKVPAEILNRVPLGFERLY